MDRIELPRPSSDQDETREPMDYISQLPDAIILHIFSFLTTTESIKTSVLSKRWRSTWTSNPYITFSLPVDKRPKRKSRNFRHFTEAFIDTVLSLWTTIKVKRLLFDVPFHASMQSSIDRLLQFAVRHNFEELSMTLSSGRSSSWPLTVYVLPHFLFRCTTLVSFHVICCCFPMTGAVNWSSLKILRIEFADIDDDAMMRLLSGSPVLESLELKFCQGFKHIRVESRALKELVIDSHGTRSLILEIWAPYLLKLPLVGNSVGAGFKVHEVSSLVEADLNFDLTYALDAFGRVHAHGDLVKGLLQRLHHVTKLVMGSWCLQVLSLMDARELLLPSFECRHLTFLIAADHKGVPGLAKILESSPCLEKLFLQLTCKHCSSWSLQNLGRPNFDAEEFWNSPKRKICRCLMHVKVVDPGANLLAWEPALSMLKFLLQNTPSLDEIAINSANSNPSKAIDPWVLPEVARIILSHARCPPSAKVILNYPSQGCPSKHARKS
ncbi:F-box/LRR-repeat protein At5g02910-like [Rhodamnia argentea]|uniref:F-box/LRR-repeat protein At5g02910-like n=1 Tax=Rhodamnia argentea TaxID=178133 RepID=A0ABM3H770_9MYRT|nr:F-box/LRR-repeat protein At5g02910-like [Rhodamnia argentea]